MLERERVDELMRDVMPARGELTSLEYVDTELRADTLALVLRLVIWQDDNGQRTIRDVKEQRVYFAPLAMELARFEAYARAWCDVLTRAFIALGLRGGDSLIDTLMPHDLVRTDVLKLKTVQTLAEFTTAFEQASRFGRMLGIAPVRGQRATTSAATTSAATSAATADEPDRDDAL